MTVTSLKNEFFRKLIHLSSVWMVAFIHLTDTSVSIPFFAGLLVLFFAFEYIRMANKPFAIFMNRHFGFMMRGNEQTMHFEWRALTGSFYFILSVLLSLVIFPKLVAMAGILIMIFADTVAALVGKSIGRHKIPKINKSIEGTVAFAIIAALILALMPLSLSMPAIFGIAVITSLIELVSNHVHINDNLSITLGSGALIMLLT